MMQSFVASASRKARGTTTRTVRKSWQQEQQNSNRTTTTTTCQTKSSNQQLRRAVFPSSSKSTSLSKRCQSSTTTTATIAAEEEVVKQPSLKTLRLVAITQAIPFIGFGFMDNAILIVAGDAIDNSLGVMLGISTLCAAAIGNIISDLAGIGMGTAIEDFCARRLNLPQPKLTSAQRSLRSVRFANQWGMAVGMTFGCIVGMFPLLFIDTSKIEQMKKMLHLETLFRDVVTEAKTLVGAESTCLYLRVINPTPGEEDNNNTPRSNPWEYIKSFFTPNSYRQMPYRPSVEGDHLYAMYYGLPSSSTSNTTSMSKEEKKVVEGRDYQSFDRIIPLGKGIVSRAVMTGEAWNISDVNEEPDFLPETVPGQDSQEWHEMLVVPVLDGQGRAIGVIRAMNKAGNDNKRVTSNIKASPDDAHHPTAKIVRKGFTDQDAQILQSLASHISVTLRYVFQDEKDDEIRLRDTIRILKEHGLQGIESVKNSKSNPMINQSQQQLQQPQQQQQQQQQQSLVSQQQHSPARSSNDGGGGWNASNNISSGSSNIRITTDSAKYHSAKNPSESLFPE